MKYKTNAPKGAALLDQKYPRWYNAINLGTLHMASSEFCVLGQTHGSYTAGAERLFGQNYRDTPGERLPTWQYGFDGCFAEQTFEALDQEWRVLIAERRAAHG
jgi:hypothetical protein